LVKLSIKHRIYSTCILVDKEKVMVSVAIVLKNIELLFHPDLRKTLTDIAMIL